jgi:hypothetical protein
MAETFHGPWSVAVIGKSSNLAQRFVISGSDNADGGYPGEVGTSIGVTGDTWSISLEWLDGRQFRPCDVRVSSGYDLFKGPHVTLAADDLGPGGGDADYDDLVLELGYENPDLDPMRPDHRKMEFTYPKDHWRERP